MNIEGGNVGIAGKNQENKLPNSETWEFLGAPEAPLKGNHTSSSVQTGPQPKSPRKAWA